jgi:hypothetical protein
MSGGTHDVQQLTTSLRGEDLTALATPDSLATLLPLSLALLAAPVAVLAGIYRTHFAAPVGTTFAALAFFATVFA